MSNASKFVLALAVSASAATIGYVHFKQTDDRAKLHEGVLRDVERQQRRKLENTYNLQKQIDLTKQLKDAEKLREKEQLKNAEKRTENFDPTETSSNTSKAVPTEESNEVVRPQKQDSLDTKSSANIFKRLFVATQGKFTGKITKSSNEQPPPQEPIISLSSDEDKSEIKQQQQQKQQKIELQVQKNPLKVIIIRKPSDDNDADVDEPDEMECSKTAWILV